MVIYKSLIRKDVKRQNEQSIVYDLDIDFNLPKGNGQGDK